jgi:hypothetical protein
MHSAKRYVSSEFVVSKLADVSALRIAEKMLKLKIFLSRSTIS